VKQLGSPYFSGNVADFGKSTILPCQDSSPSSSLHVGAARCWSGEIAISTEVCDGAADQWND
jgi:hypothetical protein